MEFKELDPILHSQLRLAVMNILMSVPEAEFTFIKEKTNSTAGNLSVQIQKLKDAGYIDVTKQFKDNYPQTICKITNAGIRAFEQYVKDLKEWQDNQYLPGYFVGSKMPLPLKQLAQKKWFRFISAVFLLVFFGFFIYFFAQMIIYIFKS